MATPPLLFLFPFLFLLLSSISIASSPPKTKLQEKLTHLHFYFHDVVAGPNATAVPVTQPAPGSQPLSAFGVLTIMDDLLTEGPDRKSPQVGRAQGMYTGAAKEELAFLMTMNLVFTSGNYSGSVLSVLGRNAPLHPVREMSVVGGSGLFRFARGYALARTHFIDFTSGEAIVEYNVYVLHY